MWKDELGSLAHTDWMGVESRLPRGGGCVEGNRGGVAKSGYEVAGRSGGSGKGVTVD